MISKCKMANATVSYVFQSGLVVIEAPKGRTWFNDDATVVGDRRLPCLLIGLECCLDRETLTLKHGGGVITFTRNGDLLTVSDGDFSAVVSRVQAIGALLTG